MADIRGQVAWPLKELLHPCPSFITKLPGMGGKEAPGNLPFNRKLLANQVASFCCSAWAG